MLIHCLPQCDASIAVRPFLNWAVAVFLFLSGYLTSERKVLGGGVLKRRFLRTLPPYVVWSVAYAALLQHASPLGTVKAVLTAGASAQMYFVAVHLQLVMITPILYQLLRRCRWLVYSVTPVCLLVYEVATAMGFAVPVLGRLFPMWMLFYVVGLDWGRWQGLLQGRLKQAICALAVCVGVQLAAGFAWNGLGDYNMATTQLKLGSMATSLCVIAVMMLLPDAAKGRLSASFLVPLGDASFGVYLCHIFFVAALGKALGLVAVPLALATVLKWLLALGLSFVFCEVAARLLPKKTAKILGVV